jgi:hypothetical protein
VPCELGELSYDEYNHIVDEFAEICQPIAKSMGFKVRKSSEDQTLEDWISGSSAKKLRLFSAAANKSTGTSHPRDQERWYEFVVSIVDNGDPLDASTLVCWLVEEGGWPEDIAHQLAIEYEQETGLLKYVRSA